MLKILQREKTLRVARRAGSDSRGGHAPRTSPDAAVLTANGGVLAGGVDRHVVERGFPDRVVRAPELRSSVGLKEKQRRELPEILLLEEKRRFHQSRRLNRVTRGVFIHLGPKKSFFSRSKETKQFKTLL